MTTEAPTKRAYKRSTNTIKVTRFQADVLFAAVVKEIATVRADKNTPTSLRVLALETLQELHDQLQPIVDANGTGEVATHS